MRRLLTVALLCVGVLGWTQTNYAEATLTNPSAALSNFPLLIDLSDMPAEWWTENDSTDGTKGRAFQGDGATEMACDWIDFDNTGETGFVRCLWASLSDTGTQKVRLFPPLAANSSYAANDTYGSDNAYPSTLEAYWPFDGATPLVDRTDAGITLTNNNATTHSAGGGKIGDTFDFEEGSSQYLDVSSGLNIADGDGPITVLAWINPESNTGLDKTVFGLSYTGGAFQWTMAMQLETTDASLSVNNRDGSGGSSIAGTANTMSTATWYFAAGDVGSGNVHAILNESIANEDDTATSNTISTPNYTEVGRINEGGGRYWDGLIDELQVYSAVLTDAWRATEYAQSNANATFWSTGWTWETPGGGGSVGAGHVVGEHFMGHMTRKVR